MMKRVGFGTLLCALLNCGACYGKPMTNAPVTQNPYSKISARNIFQLRQPPVVHIEPPKVPAPKITLTGIIANSRGKRAMFKVQFPPRPREPADAEYCTLKEGKRYGQLRVLEINETTGIVKVDNYGTIMEITFEKPKTAPQIAAPQPNVYSLRYPVRSVRQ
jgi:hypothetical protein